jgi:hypothetical protein
MLYLTNDEVYGLQLFSKEPILEDQESGGKIMKAFESEVPYTEGYNACIEPNDISENLEVPLNGKVKVKVVRDDSEDKFKPFDVVLYKPTNEEGIVKRVTKDGVFVLFRIQSTAQLCKFEDLEI